ncbi:MAG: hypothetical protein ACP6IY_20830 [Promethearchaeia archaeon]
MTIKRQKYLVSLLILFIFSLTTPTLISAWSSDDITITEGTSYKWTYEKFDSDKYFDAFGTYPYLIAEGIKIEITIEKIKEMNDYYSVEIEQIRYKNNDNVKTGESLLIIAKKPESYNPTINYLSLGLVPFILKDAEDFLKDWIDYINSSSYSLDGLELSLKLNNDTRIIWIYQENGILSSQIIEHKDDSICELILETSSVIPFGVSFLFFMIITIAGIIITIKKRGVLKG